MNWETHKRGTAPAGCLDSIPTPTLRITISGDGTLNQAARTALVDTKHVVLLWEPNRRLLGIQPADINHPDRYQLRHHGGRVEVGLKGFLQSHDIHISEPVVLSGEVSGNMLVFDLSDLK